MSIWPPANSFVFLPGLALVSIRLNQPNGLRTVLVHNLKDLDNRPNLRNARSPPRPSALLCLMARAMIASATQRHIASNAASEH